MRARYVEQFRGLVPGVVVYQIQVGGDRTIRRIWDRGCSTEELGRRMADNLTESTAGCPVADRIFVSHATVGDLVDSVANALVIDFPGRSALAPVAPAPVAP